MSYCRFSSDNFNCDLYCYQGDAFYTHVAGYRWRAWFRLFQWLTAGKRLKITNSLTYRTSRWNLWCLPHWVTHKKIRHPDAGKTFKDETEAKMFQTIRDLSEEGFRVPKYLLEDL